MKATYLYIFTPVHMFFFSEFFIKIQKKCKKGVQKMYRPPKNVSSDYLCLRLYDSTEGPLCFTPNFGVKHCGISAPL